MNRIHHWFVVLAIYLAVALGPMSSRLVAQPPTASKTVTIEMIEERRAQVSEASELKEEVKTSIAKIYTEATEQLQRIPAFDQRRAELANDSQSASRRADEDKQSLVSLRASPPQPVTQKTLGEIQQEVLRREQTLRGLQEKLAANQQRASTRPSRRKEIRSRLAVIEADLQRIDTDLAAALPTGESPLLTQARNTALIAEQLRLNAEQPMLESELLLLDAEAAAECLRYRGDLLIEQTARAKTELALAQQLAQTETDRATNAAADDAGATVADVPASLQPLAERNADLVKQLREVNELSKVAGPLRDAIRDELKQTKNGFQLTRTKVDSVGLQASLGKVLRHQRGALRSPSSLRKQWEKRQIEAGEVQLQLLNLREERSRLVDPERPAAELNGIDEEMRAEAERILGKRREHLDSLMQAKTRYFDMLTETSVNQQQLAEVNEQFAKYIDERILWVQSDDALWKRAAWRPAVPVQAVQADTGHAATGKLREAVYRVGSDVRQQPWLYIIFLVGWAALVRFSQTLKHALPELARGVRRRRSSRFTPTLRAAVYSIAIALPVPLLFWFLASRFDVVAGEMDACDTLASGFRVFAAALFPLELFRQFCRPHGLAPAHFAWSDSTVRMLRQSCRNLVLTVPPLLLIGHALSVDEDKAIHHPLEQLIFVVCLLLCAWHAYRLLHPQSGVFQRYLRRDPQTWAARLQYVWQWAAVGLPAWLAVLTVQGYFYTSQKLAVRTYVSIASAATLVIIYSLITRFFAMQRRCLHLEQMELRRETLAAATPDDDVPAADSLTVVPLSVSHHHTTQTKRFVGWFLCGIGLIGLWAVWSDVLPALEFLERWPLWNSTNTITELIADEAGNQTIRTRPVVDPITIAEVVAAILFGVITFVAARNLPGLLEISVLRRLPIDESVRYAITTLGSYVIIILGLIVTCQWIGLRWNQIQWMATALTLGLAIGLQEMFANFVAGVIILFEQPIRVGDIVTVDDVTGKVARVRMRATTITNWDRKDYIVPNKEFITGPVLNWTLSDKVNRIVLTVGVAYGSDKDKVRLLLLDIARRHQIIVDDPQPTVTFEEFATSSLTFVLRGYIDMKNMPMRMQVVDDLHTRVDDAFRDAGIEIAFPQQDIRIREVPGSTVSSEVSGETIFS